MALLFMDGFDHYDDDYQADKWTSFSTDLVNILPTSGRRGGGCLELSHYSYSGTRDIPATGTVILGGAMWILNWSSTFGHIVLKRLGQTQIRVQWGASGEAKLFVGSSQVDSSVAGIITATEYNYLEVKAVIHASAGSVEIRKNGNTVYTFNGDTLGDGADALVDGVNMWGDMYLDDFYICDDSGTANNDFLGDVKIECLYPDADGTYADFTCSSGTDHYALVDENPLSEADYVESDTTGHKDSYGVTAPASLDNETILAVQAVHALNMPAAGNANVKGLVRSGAADYLEATAITVASAITLHTDVREADPADSATWTRAKLDAAEFGIEITS